MKSKFPGAAPPWSTTVAGILMIRGALLLAFSTLRALEQPVGGMAAEAAFKRQNIRLNPITNAQLQRQVSQELNARKTGGLTIACSALFAGILAESGPC